MHVQKDEAAKNVRPLQLALGLRVPWPYVLCFLPGREKSSRSFGRRPAASGTGGVCWWVLVCLLVSMGARTYCMLFLLERPRAVHLSAHIRTACLIWPW